MKDINSLCTLIEKSFPKFFGDFTNWEYSNGKDASKDFKKILILSQKIKITQLSKKD